MQSQTVSLGKQRFCKLVECYYQCRRGNENLGLFEIARNHGGVSGAFGVVFPDFAGMGETSARAAFVIGQDGVVKYAEQTATLKDMPNFAAVKAALAK